MDNLGDMLREYTRLANDAANRRKKVLDYIDIDLSPKLINLARQGKSSFWLQFKNFEFSNEELEMMCDVLRGEGLMASWNSDMTDKNVRHLHVEWR